MNNSTSKQQDLSLKKLTDISNTTDKSAYSGNRLLFLPVMLYILYEYFRTPNKNTLTDSNKFIGSVKDLGKNILTTAFFSYVVSNLQNSHKKEKSFDADIHTEKNMYTHVKGIINSIKDTWLFSTINYTIDSVCNTDVVKNMITNTIRPETGLFRSTIVLVGKMFVTSVIHSVITNFEKSSDSTIKEVGSIAPETKPQKTVDDSKILSKETKEKIVHTSEEILISIPKEFHAKNNKNYIEIANKCCGLEKYIKKYYLNLKLSSDTIYKGVVTGDLDYTEVTSQYYDAILAGDVDIPTAGAPAA